MQLPRQFVVWNRAHPSYKLRDFAASLPPDDWDWYFGKVEIDYLIPLFSSNYVSGSCAITRGLCESFRNMVMLIELCNMSIS